MSNDERSSIGQRIHVLGNSSSGKSTVGLRLSRALGVPFVELDALNWEPGWVGLNDTNPDELERRFREATKSDGWVAAGSYISFSQRAFWPRLQTAVYLDLPIPQLLWRMLTRSWRRWRSGEVLWGTNKERFWQQLMFWRKEDSLLWWIVTQQSRKRKRWVELVADPQWTHVRFVRLTSSREIEVFIRSVEARALRSRSPH